MAYPASGPVALEINLGDLGLGVPLKSGDLRSDLVTLTPTGPKAAHNGFKPMLRENRFDGGELAIVTFLQALEYGKPLVLLPAVVFGSLKLGALVFNSERHPTFQPRDLEGRRIGMRAYSQTTGVWLRGVLQHEYGVDLQKLTWVCAEEGHPAEYRDPPNVERIPAGGKSIEDQLVDGEIDAAIPAAALLANPAMKPVMADPQAKAHAWREKYRTIHINHMFVLRPDLVKTRPDVVREVWRLLREAKARVPAGADGVDLLPIGIEAVRPSLDLIIGYALEQKLITRRFTVDELFQPVAGLLD